MTRRAVLLLAAGSAVAAFAGEVPRPADSIKATLEGRPLDLAQYRGQTVVIEFLNPT